MEIPNIFHDEYFNIHERGEVLGAGGQGIVFRTKDPGIAVKLRTSPAGEPLPRMPKFEENFRRFINVRLLPLPEHIPISLPITLLQDHVGYVMSLLNNMVPIGDLLGSKKKWEKIRHTDIPEWLSEMNTDAAKELVYYHQTGGLRRRLAALSNCAAIFSRLHASGFVYGDVSPNNIFISNGTAETEVWLIDSDNLRFVAFGGNSVYTPKFGAPEVVQNTAPASPASDTYSFAITAFLLLSTIHPFNGNLLTGNTVPDWADQDTDSKDAEKKAEAGELPWVDDSKDDSNASASGLPRQLLLTPELKHLFERTFEEGRISPHLRPAVHHWAPAFARAADTAIQCPGCTMSYYFDIEIDTCPYCGTGKPKMVCLDAYTRDNSGAFSVHSWRFIREKGDVPILVPQRVFCNFSMKEQDASVLKITFPNEKLLFQKSDQTALKLYYAVPGRNDERFKELDYKVEISLENRSPEPLFYVFSNSPDPRIVRCSIMDGKNGTF